jgi:hypothetical protein
MAHAHDDVPPQSIIFYRVGRGIRPSFQAEHDSRSSLAGQERAPTIGALTAFKISLACKCLASYQDQALRADLGKKNIP